MLRTGARRLPHPLSPARVSRSNNPLPPLPQHPPGRFLKGEITTTPPTSATCLQLEWPMLGSIGGKHPRGGVENRHHHLNGSTAFRAAADKSRLRYQGFRTCHQYRSTRSIRRPHRGIRSAINRPHPAQSQRRIFVRPVLTIAAGTVHPPDGVSAVRPWAVATPAAANASGEQITDVLILGNAPARRDPPRQRALPGSLTAAVTPPATGRGLVTKPTRRTLSFVR